MTIIAFAALAVALLLVHCATCATLNPDHRCLGLIRVKPRRLALVVFACFLLGSAILLHQQLW